jgi:hypothetical protein
MLLPLCRTLSFNPSLSRKLSSLKLRTTMERLPIIESQSQFETLTTGISSSFKKASDITDRFHRTDLAKWIYGRTRSSIQTAKLQLRLLLLFCFKFI